MIRNGAIVELIRRISEKIYQSRGRRDDVRVKRNHGDVENIIGQHHGRSSLFLKMEGKSVPISLHMYGRYANTVSTGTRHVVPGTSTAEPVQKVHLKFSVEVDFPKFILISKIFPNAAFFNALNDAQVHAFLDDFAKNAKDVVTLDL